MPTYVSHRWRQVAWFAALAVAVLVAWRLVVLLIEAARRRWPAGRSM